MAKYKYYDYSQSVMVPVCLEDQLMPGTLDLQNQFWVIVISGCGRYQSVREETDDQYQQ